MKREILFRGKRIDNGEWVEGFYVHKSEYKHQIVTAESIFPTLVIPETVGQFTGLTDKNGTKIFDGDVCKFETCSNKYQKKVVEYYKYGFFVGDYPVGDNCEVIGNIHDNPELI